MSYKVIDSDDYESAGIETMFFPGGEPHIKLPKGLYNLDTKHDPELLFLKLRTWNDCGIAALLIDALENADTRVFIPYFPGARQDKGLPRTLDITAKLLEPFYGCDVFDPHSDETAGAFAVGGTTWMPSDLDVPIKDDVVGIIAPDAGAQDRARNFKMKFYPNANIIYCAKERDSKSGKLSNYATPRIEQPGRYIVVDDICDGGGTFNLFAEAFNKENSQRDKKLELFISHGIFSHKLGLGNIDPVYEHITTTDSWCQIDKVKGYWKVEDGRLSTVPRLTVLPLAQLFDRIMSND